MKVKMIFIDTRYVPVDTKRVVYPDFRYVSNHFLDTRYAVSRISYLRIYIRAHQYPHPSHVDDMMEDDTVNTGPSRDQRAGTE